MRLGKISKLFLLLSVFLVSLMAVSAVNLDINFIDIKASATSTDSKIYTTSDPTCKFRVTSTNSTITAVPNGLSAVVDWTYDGEALDQAGVTITAFDAYVNTAFTLSTFDVGKTISCKITATWTNPEDTENKYTDSAEDSTTVLNTPPALNIPAGTDTVTLTEDADETLWEGAAISTFANDVDDAEKTGLTFTVTGDSAKVSCLIDADGSNFRYKPAANFYTTTSNAYCTITVKDAQGAQASDKVYFKVNKLIDDEPTMASGAIPDDQKAATQSTFTLDVKSYISNPDGITLAYSLENAPKGMTISSSGVITFATGDNVTTHDNIKVVASYTFNNEAKTLSDIFKLTVSPPSKIKVSELNIYVNGNKDDDVDEDNLVSSLEDSVKPGDTIKIAMKVENTWPEDTEDHDIKDIIAEVKFEEMGNDEDDVEKDLDFGRVEPGDESNKKEISHTLPTDIDDGTYYIKIDLDGEDEDGSDYKNDDVIVITVEVEKEDHKLDFDKFTLTPSTLECSRTTQLSVKLVNTGDSAEDDVQLVLSASDFNFEEVELLELESGSSDDDDVYFSKTYTLNVPENKKAGTYVIKGTAYYNGEDEEEDETVVATLTLVDCGTTTATTTTPSATTPKTESKETVEVVETQPQTTATTPAISTSVSADEGKSFFESGLYVGILVAAVIIVLLIIIIMVVAIARR